MRFAWWPELSGEIESVSSAEVGEKDIDAMGLFWDWIPKDEAKVPPVLPVFKKVDPKFTEWCEEWDRRIEAANHQNGD